MKYKEQNDKNKANKSNKFIKYCKNILQSQSFRKYFKIILLLTFCIIEIIDMTKIIFVSNRDFSDISNEYILFLILVLVELIMIPLVYYDKINLILKELIFCCLLDCLFESFIQNQKNILRLGAFFIFSQKTMNDIKQIKGVTIAILIVIIYPLIRFSVVQISNIPQLFQYFLLIIANVLFSFIYQPDSQSKQDINNTVQTKENINKNTKIVKHDTNQSSVVQNGGDIYGYQAEDQYLNNTRQDQNSLLEINNHMNLYNISMNDDEAYPNSNFKQIQMKNGKEFKNQNLNLKEREIYINKTNINKKFQSISSVDENTIQSNHQNQNKLLYNLNFISTGIIILNQNKNLIYSNKQCQKFLKQYKKYDNLDEVSQILSINLQNNQSQTQKSQKDNNQQQQKINKNKYQIKGIANNEKIEKILDEQKQNREKELNKTSKRKQKQNQYGNVIYNQYQSIKNNKIKQENKQKSDGLRKNFKKITSVEVLYSNQMQEFQNKNLQNPYQISSKQFSHIMRENSQSQPNIYGCCLNSNLGTSNINIKSPQVQSLQHSLNNFNNIKSLINLQEIQISQTELNQYNYLDQKPSKVLQCKLPKNINKLFTKNDLLIDDLLNFLIKFSVSPQYQKLNTDNQLQSDSDETKSEQSQENEIQREINKKKKDQPKLIKNEDEIENEQLDFYMLQQIKNDQNQSCKNSLLENNYQNFKQGKQSIAKEEKARSNYKQQQKNNENQKMYNYFIQSNYLHLIVNLKDDSNDKQERTIIEIKLCVLIQIGEDKEEKLVQIEVSDITKLKKQVDNEHLEEYKNKILSSVSHELRTPLNCSIQMLEMLTENEDIPDILKQMFVFPALNSNFLLLYIINDILDLAQINQGKFTLQFSQFELNRICAECVNLISMQALQKNIEIELDLDPKIPKETYSDQNRIRQVLLNLLSNALKFTQKGKITIRTILKEEKLIQIDIEDTGCGITEKNLNTLKKGFGKKNIFNFEDVINKKQLNTVGAGLGLTITNNLAAGLGANRKLQISSLENSGTKFQFWIVDHPRNKIGCDFIYKSIFSQEVVKWQSISDCSQKQSKLSQQFHVQYDSRQTNSQKISTNSLGGSQSLVNFSIVSKKKNEDSTNNQMTNKYAQSVQQLIKFNTEINQNIFQSQISQNNNILNNQKQETNSILSQNHSLHEEGKTKKFQLQFREQTQISEDHGSNFEQHLYPQFLDTFKRQTYDQNNSKYQVLESFLKSDSEVSQIQKNEIRSFEKVYDQVNHQQDLNQENQISSTNQNKMKNRNSSLSSLHIIQESKNLSSLCQFPTKTSTQIPNKPNSDLLPNIILSTLNSQVLLFSQHDNKIHKPNNITALFTPKPINDEIDQQNDSSQQINLFQPSINTKEQRKDEIKSTEIKEGLSDIISQNEIKFIQIPNQFNLQKVSQKRKLVLNQNSKPNQINVINNPQIMNNLAQEVNIYSNSQTENDGIIEWDSSYKKTSEEPKQQVTFNQIKFNVEQTTSEEKQEVEENQFQLINSYNDKNLIKSQKTSALPYNLSVFTSKDQKNDIQSKNETNNNSKFLINKKEEKTINHILQDQQIINNHQTVKQQIQEYNSKRTCLCSNILIVDDNNFNIYALEIRLKQYGFIIDKAISGILAFQLIKNKFEGQIQQQCCKLYTLIFMDIDMPIKNGYETTKEILEYYKENNIDQPPPISACTAYVQQSEQIKAKQSGMLYYIIKPINQQKLEDLLAEVIKNTNYGK